MSALTLDDAATLLLQLDVNDIDDLARLREQLVELAFGNSVSIAAQPHIAKAARLILTLTDRSAVDPAAVFAEINSEIDQASSKMDASADRIVQQVRTRTVSKNAVSADSLPDDTDKDLLGDFLNEGSEFLENAELALLSLELDPENEESINTVFRAFHTLKGTSAFLGLKKVAEFAHEAESLLSRVRDKQIDYSRQCAELSLASSDMLKALLASIRVAAEGNGFIEVPEGYDQLLVALTEYSPTDTIELGSKEVHKEKSVKESTSEAADQSITQGVSVSENSSPAYSASDNPGRRKSDKLAENTIRVRTDRLDRLIDMVGELVIAQSLITGDETMEKNRQLSLGRKVTHAGKIVRELQDLSMSMRMVELKPTFQKLSRVVRDTAVKANKDVSFSYTGDDVELDRQLADLLGDPLIHMVRNAVDHGIETSEARVQAGKSEKGSVSLHAYHASGNVVVELRDDGQGLRRDKIVAKAIAKGMIESDKGMSDSEVFGLIFSPGFSTAEKVTDISGRGVGLDVVRRNLETIRGRIEISSQPGKGTIFVIRLPLTLAVTDGMLIRVGEERFVVPITNIQMSFRPDASMLSTIAGKGEAVLLRGELMPIVRLHDVFKVDNAVLDPVNGLLMIVGDAERKTALLVDELLGQQQVVAKTLGESLGKVPGISGGAILGDGRVGLIIDITETVSLALGNIASRTQSGSERVSSVEAA